MLILYAYPIVLTLQSIKDPFVLGTMNVNKQTNIQINESNVCVNSCVKL